MHSVSALPTESDEPIAGEESADRSGEVTDLGRVTESWLCTRAYLAVALGVLVRLAFCTELGVQCIQARIQAVPGRQ